MRMLIAVGSADVAVDLTASGRGQEPSQVWWRQLAMRQLGEGVQSEERQMLLPFLRHLSLRPAAASWQTVLVGNDLRIVLFWLAGNSPGAGEVPGSSPARVTISMKTE